MPQVLQFLLWVWSIDIAAVDHVARARTAVCRGFGDRGRLRAAVGQLCTSRCFHRRLDAAPYPRHLRHVHGRHRGDRQGRRARSVRLRSERVSADEHAARAARHRARARATSSAHLDSSLDCVVVGNALSRGKPVVEALLDSGLPYYSGPQWLAEQRAARQMGARGGGHARQDHDDEHARVDPRVRGPRTRLPDRRRADATSASRRGSAARSTSSSRPTSTTRRSSTSARSSCTTGRARSIVNNIEFDHADIYADVDAILWQFHQLCARCRATGLIVANGRDANVDALLRARRLDAGRNLQRERSRRSHWFGGLRLDRRRRRASASSSAAPRSAACCWPLLGLHNLENALAAIAAAVHVGVPPDVALAALAEFKGVKRRLEKRGTFGGISVYEDFAHHPTAIATTLAGLRSRAPAQRIVAVMEPRSNTMRMGVHRDTLAGAFAGADRRVRARRQGPRLGSRRRARAARPQGCP